MFIRLASVLVGLTVTFILLLSSLNFEEERRILRVALYPYLPGRAELFRDLEEEFRRRFPGVGLEILDLSAGYYDTRAPSSVSSARADVYEIDSVFLDDFVAARRIQELPGELAPKPREFLENARAAALLNGKWYGVPHWICGNFLFYEITDVELSSVRSLRDLEVKIGRNRTPGRGLLIDLKGKSTLGELYLDAAFDRHNEWPAVEEHLNLEKFDGAVANDLARILRLCEPSYCRSQRYHEASGFYARQFARKRGRALVGYSEALFHVLSEARQSCSDGEGCLSDRKIAVSELPLADRGSRPIAWVDMFTISAECTGECVKNAVNFIQLANSDAMLLKALLPKDLPPRYLLPARLDIYRKDRLLENAPLYSKFLGLIEKAATPTGPRLNDRLRALGGELDSRLAKANR